MTAFNDTVRFCFPGSFNNRDLPYQNPTRSQRNDGDQEVTRGTAKMTFWTVLRSYAPDWTLVVVMWYVLLYDWRFGSNRFWILGTETLNVVRAILALLNRSAGHKREFSLTDTTIQHSFAENERVPHTFVYKFFSMYYIGHIDTHIQIARHRLGRHTLGCICPPQCTRISKQVGCTQFYLRYVVFYLRLAFIGKGSSDHSKACSCRIPWLEWLLRSSRWVLAVQDPIWYLGVYPPREPLIIPFSDCQPMRYVPLQINSG